MRVLTAFALIGALVACGEDMLEQLASDDPGPAREELLRRGPEAVPLLRTGMASRDRVLARRALELMAKLTAQWGSHGGIAWKRSLDEARAEAGVKGKSILLLQLFGSLDQEFC